MTMFGRPGCVLRVAIAIPTYQLFDYLPPASVEPEKLRPGARVRVPFGPRTKVGYVVETADRSEYDPQLLRPVAEILDETPLLFPQDLQLLLWAARYYHHPIGEVLQTAFPAPLRHGGKLSAVVAKGLSLTETGAAVDLGRLARSPVQRALLERLRRSDRPLTLAELSSGMEASRLQHGVVRRLLTKGWVRWVDLPKAAAVSDLCGSSGEHPLLNPAQSQAVEAVTRSFGRFACFLLAGVTGSGKTEVYLELIRQVVARGEQALLLVPEISLTPQLETRLRAGIGAPVAVFHSGLSESQRQSAWLGMQKGEVGVLLGTRSAVFTPMRKPGLIVLDEEHDRSYKQQEGFRFSARDVAIMRARLAGVPLVAGSATPSLESLHNVRRGRHHLLRLPARAGNAVEPRYRLLDIRGRKMHDGLSEALLAAMREALAEGGQVLLFLNRRGFAPVLICHHCGWVAQCRRCDASLVLHQREARLRCHHCGVEQALPPGCAVCAQNDLRPLGVGTERIERALQRFFPDTGIARIDRDSTRARHSLERILDEVRRGSVRILLGTQMLAKGHHFPDVTLVGIVDVDAGLYSTDFRAAESTAQLIVQVAGRAGRGERPGTVLLQTRHPTHPLLLCLLREGYRGFAAAELAAREAAGLPPFTFHALWRAESRTMEAAMNFLEKLKQALESEGKEISCLGPAPAPRSRLAGRYRAQLWLRSSRRMALHQALEVGLESMRAGRDRSVRWSLDVDPVDLY
ncbi:MAG TPA: primosomal protein N' [Methylococcus sp.]|nr:primosomal protein N' [Methylococcus sp.]